MAANASWGVEVGSGGLKAVKLVRDGESVQVVDFAIIPHKKPLSAPEIDATDAMRVAIGTLVSQHDLGGATLSISVPGSQSFARFAKLPPVDKKNLVDVVKFEAVQQIPFPIDEVQWDYQTFQAPDSPDVEVGIFAIRTENVMEILHKWQDVGRTPDILTLSPLAAYNAIAWDENFSEKTAGTVILDVGTTSTDLIIAENGGLWIRTFPIGGHQFTEALVTAFNLSYMKAEKLKGEAESSQHARHILQAMRPVFGDLAQDVQRSISYYTSTHKEAKLTRLIGLGSTFQLPGLRKFLSQQLSMEVTRLDKFGRISKFAGGREAEYQEHASELATAFGLALQGLGNQIIDANMVPVSVVKEAMWRDKTKWFVAAAAIALAAGTASLLKPAFFEKSAMGGEKPRVIEDAKSEAARLKKRWSDAEAEYQPDPRAAGLLQIGEARDVIPKVVDDTQAMLASAAAKIGTMPGTPAAEIEFVDFVTQYMGPGTSADPNGGPPPVAAPGERGRVHATLRININRPASQADAIIQQAFQGWLRANARHRPDYEIRTPVWAFEKSVNENGDVVTGSATPSPGMPGPGGPVRPPERPVPGPGGKNRVGPGGPGGGFMMPGGPGMRPPVAPGGGNPGGGGGGASSPLPGSDDVDKFAPLPKWTGLAKPGATITTYVITWDAVLKAPGEEAPK